MESMQIAPRSPLPEIEIRPARRWGELRLGELFEFRELLFFLFKRELQIRYKQSLLGIVWVVIQPLGLAALFALVFGLLIKIPSDGPYVPFALAGLVPWVLNSQAISLCSTSLVSDGSLLSKVYFPRLAIPIAKVSALLLDFTIAFTVALAVTLAYGISLSATVLLVPFFVLLTVVTAFGAGCLLAALNVKYRDVTIATPLMLQVWLFCSPIIYPSSLVPGDWKYIYFLNPMASVIDGIRWCVLGKPGVDPVLLALSWFSALIVFAVGLVYFRRTEQSFADII
jgi:lipopolysaccharide transport system permease protein